MSTNEIRFSDGGAYDRYMGVWSQLVGRSFLDWLTPPVGVRWLDVGCGSGAFTELILDACAPASVHGIDPSEPQIAYARTRLGPRGAAFGQGDAMAIPFPDASFDLAVMPLVIFFVPDPARGVAEMARVVARDGIVAAYGWDMAGNGFPYATLRFEMTAMGLTVPQPPSPDASSLDSLAALWHGAGFEDVDTRVITVERTFDSFDEYWTTVLGAPSVGPTLRALAAGQLEHLQTRVREHLPSDARGRITYAARANAVRGRRA